MRICVRTARRFLIPSTDSDSDMTGDGGGGGMMLMSQALMNAGTSTDENACCEALPLANPPYAQVRKEARYRYRRMRNERKTKEALHKHVVELEGNLMPHM